jgi:hypothetical protein
MVSLRNGRKRSLSWLRGDGRGEFTSDGLRPTYGAQVRCHTEVVLGIAQGQQLVLRDGARSAELRAHLGLEKRQQALGEDLAAQEVRVVERRATPVGGHDSQELGDQLAQSRDIELAAGARAGAALRRAELEESEDRGGNAAECSSCGHRIVGELG